jgi:plasmid stability protein
MADRQTGRNSDQFNLRMPEGMREQLKDAAAANGRSLNAEIIARLLLTLELDQAQPSKFGQQVAAQIEAIGGLPLLDIDKIRQDTERDRESIKAVLEDIKFHREELKSMQNELSQQIFEMRRKNIEAQKDGDQ